MKKWMAIVMIAAAIFSLTACGSSEETTLTGMVVSVDGTVISLAQMDADSMGGKTFSDGERPKIPEGMEDFDFESFNPEDFDGTLPEGESFPQRGDGEMPEMPEGMTPPEGMTMPENGQLPEFDGEKDGKRPNFGNFAADMETKDVDIGNAHISVEIETGKESGTMENIVPGAFVTITMNGKGEATYVLVSSQTAFSGKGQRSVN